jgi:site-specific recombinase XerD
LKIWSYSLSHRIDGTGQLVEKANKYFEAAEVHGCSPDSVRTYAFGLMTFFRWLNQDWDKFKKFNQKDLQDWMTFLKNKGFQPNSINQRLHCVRGFYKFCFGVAIPHAAGVIYPRGYTHVSGRRGLYRSPYPQRRVTELKVKVPQRVVDPLKPIEVDKFMAHLLRYRDVAIVLTMMTCGLRSLEVISLRLEDIDFHQCQMRVRGKGRKERIVPLCFQIMKAFEKYLTMERPKHSVDNFFVVLRGEASGKKLNRESFRAFFRYHRNKSGVKKARPHEFRHLFASDLARAGVSVAVIQELLGHAELKTSQIYIDLFIDDVRAEYDKAMKRIGERYAALSK